MSIDTSGRRTYFLNYEFHGDPDYAAMRKTYVVAFVKKISGLYCRPMADAWFFLSEMPASTILADISGYLADEDRLSLVEVGDSCGWHGFLPEDRAWLKQHL